jgi:DNA repair photolyase
MKTKNTYITTNNESVNTAPPTNHSFPLEAEGVPSQPANNAAVVTPPPLHSVVQVVINKGVALTEAQAKATYTWTGIYQNGKPVFKIPTCSGISLDSAFAHKKLCEGPTFTLGFACHFTCLFCYVLSTLNRHSAILRILKETGLTFDQITIEKDDPLPVLAKELSKRDGSPKYNDPADTRVIYSFPLVDVAANLPTAELALQACRMILEKTHWQIRLLSKSALLKTMALGLAEYKDRVIYGLSTGTFQDKLAASFELHTASPTARLQTLHWLQDNGYRTFGMLCPSLPQDDYGVFADHAAQAIRVGQCEHVWAEVLNARGKSLTRTCEGLRGSGFE